MCKKAVVFAGTTEGRKIAEYLSRQGVPVIVSTATEYGGELVEKNEFLAIRSGPMDAEEMLDFLKKENPRIVVDATHPYAKEVTENVKRACKVSQINYLRLLRQTKKEEDAVYVATAKEAAEYLNHTTGNVLITTGSKELAAFTEVVDYRKRLYARVLSLPKVVTECDHLGFCGSHLFAMQGPFSEEMNLALLRQIRADYLVTKETGSTGGFEEKCRAAKKNGTKILVIGRPEETEGDSFEDCLEKLKAVFGIRENLPVTGERTGYTLPEQDENSQMEISLVGIGTGAESLLTAEAKETFGSADVIIGAKRMVEAVVTQGQACFYSYMPKEIASYISEHPEYQKIAIALSGDAGFYSGAKKLLEVLPENTKVMPGISSLIYFAARLKTSWEDIVCASLHGKQDNVIGMLKYHPRVFILLGKSEDAKILCRKLTDYGMGSVKVSLGENLSYPEEKITVGRAETLTDIMTEPLCVCLLERKKEEIETVTYGIADEAFLRDKVPMTKEEIRSIVLSKLCLHADSVVYDIGAGTGSVAVEAARILTEGSVYAIEKNADALSLLEKNRKKFAVDNMQIIAGRAPEALKELPMPTHAFIGGSSGDMREILKVLFSKNPQMRIVVTAVSLETIAETTRLLKEFTLTETETVSVTVAKAKELGNYHLMMGQNPVFIFSFRGGN